MDDCIARKLGLDGTPERLCIRWTSNIVREEPKSKRVSFQISSASNTMERYTMHNVHTVSKLSLPK